MTERSVTDEENALREVGLSTAHAILVARERFNDELLSATTALETERGQLATAQAIAQVGSWTGDLNTGTLRCSEENYRIFGLNPEEPVGFEAFFERVHPDDRPAVTAAFGQVATLHAPFSLDHRLILADGALKWVQQRCEIAYDAEGRACAVAGTTQDITERKIAESVLERSQQLLRIASRVGRIGGWDIDLASLTISWSEEVCAIHGVPPGFHPPVETAIDFYASEYRDVMRAVVDACISDGTPFDEEVEIVNLQGERVWVRAIGEAQLDRSGNVTGVRGAFQDISERMGALHALRESNERFRLVAQAATDVVWDWLVADDTCWWSDGLQARFGYPDTPERQTRDFWASNIHPDDRQRVVEGFGRAVRGQVMWSDEYRFRRADGSFAQVSDRARIERQTVGGASRVVGAMVDVTVQRTLEARLEQAQRTSTLGRMASNMAHEFNNVLMGIQPFVEVIRRTTDNPKARHASDSIAESVRRGKAITDEILRFTSRVDPVAQPLDVRDWLIEFASESSGPAAIVASSESVAGDPAFGPTPAGFLTPIPLPKIVLIVDDEPMVVDGISHLLAAEGLMIKSVFDGGTAIAAIERHTPELVLLDIGLPDISGVEVFKRIQDRWPEMRVVLMTGHYGRDDLGSILELPNVGFLQKPFGSKELLRALHA